MAPLFNQNFLTWSNPSINRVGFTPLSISGLKLWLDADDLSTITKDGSDLVSQWDDKSGEGNHVAEGTGSKQPLFVANSMNSKDIIRFDGVDNRLRRTTFVNGELTQPNTIFIVVKEPPDNHNYYGDYFYDGGTAGKRHGLVERTDSPNDYLILSEGGVVGGTATFSTAQQYTAFYDSPNSILRKAQSDIITGGSTGTQAMNGVSLASHVTEVLTLWGQIDIAEMLIYDSLLSNTDRDAVEDYLADKWGL